MATPHLMTCPAGASDARLQSWVTRIWGVGGEGSPVRVSLGPPPAGFLVAEEYAVLPHPQQARLLVPLGSRRAAAASLRTYSATRARGSRMMRRTLAAAYTAGVADMVFRHRLVVSLDPRLPRRQWSDYLVIEHLARALDQSSLRAFTAVRRINSNAKPTLELFDDAGHAVGYAKLGTTGATKALVRNEASTLAALSGTMESVHVPRLLSAGAWNQAEYAVASPLPSDVHRWKHGPTATADAVSRIARSGAVSRAPLAGSSYAARLRDDLRATFTHAEQSEVASTLLQWLQRLERNRTPVEFGRMHGDWISDNLGQCAQGMAVWDWEHSSDDAPVGFDLLHWSFHDGLVKAGLPTALLALDLATSQLATLGVEPDAHRLTASLYLLDSFTRQLRLAAGGGGWNRRWYPGLLDVARARDLD